MSSSINSLTTELHNGITIPVFGYRADKDHGNRNYENILTAIQAGFRHFDIACDGEAEKTAGRAFKDSGLKRYELFLTAKLDNDSHGYHQTLRAFENTLKRLGTDYIDLYLINWPNPVRYRSNYEETLAKTWEALETMYKNGKVHAIGVANFEARHIEFTLEHSEISPMVNQARVYPGFPFKDNVECANEHKIQTIGFLPPMHDAILSCKELQIFADKYHVTPRQICARYLLEKSILPLCQGNDIAELSDVFNTLNFSLSREDMLFLGNMGNYGPDNINPDTCDF